MVDILKIFGHYAMILLVIGTIGNCIIVYVSNKSQKISSTFVLFRYLALNNAFTLYYWNLSHFIHSNFNFDIQNFNIYVCKFGSWIQYSSLQSSAWILVNFYDFFLRIILFITKFIFFKRYSYHLIDI